LFQQAVVAGQSPDAALDRIRFFAFAVKAKRLGIDASRYFAWCIRNRKRAAVYLTDRDEAEGQELAGLQRGRDKTSRENSNSVLQKIICCKTQQAKGASEKKFQSDALGDRLLQFDAAPSKLSRRPSDLHSIRDVLEQFA
jgi:hypothetical protein